MKTLFFALLFTFGAVGLWTAVTSSPAQAQSTGATTAESQSATFAIENVTCALCPVTVRKAMEGVSGVQVGQRRFREQDRHGPVRPRSDG